MVAGCSDWIVLTRKPTCHLARREETFCQYDYYGLPCLSPNANADQNRSTFVSVRRPDDDDDDDYQQNFGPVTDEDNQKRQQSPQHFDQWLMSSHNTVNHHRPTGPRMRGTLRDHCRHNYGSSSIWIIDFLRQTLLVFPHKTDSETATAIEPLIAHVQWLGSSGGVLSSVNDSLSPWTDEPTAHYQTLYFQIAKESLSDSSAKVNIWNSESMRQSVFSKHKQALKTSTIIVQIVTPMHCCAK